VALGSNLYNKKKLPGKRIDKAQPIASFIYSSNLLNEAGTVLGDLQQITAR
jgi:hypothetical protein